MSLILIVRDAGMLVINSTAEHSEEFTALRVVSFCSDIVHGFVHTVYQLFFGASFP